MCRQDQLRGSYEYTYSISWFEFGPPISIFAPPEFGGAPARVPLIWKADEETNSSKGNVKALTWMLRNLTPLQFGQVPSTAVVWPCPFATGPLTIRVALESSVGWPTVLISWLGAANRIGAWIM